MAGINISSAKFRKVLLRNNYDLVRQSGDHYIFKHKSNGNTVSVPQKLNPLIAKRLVKENNLIL